MSDDADQELRYEPLRPKRRRGRAADIQADAIGQTVEYEHGYLRQKAKEARGVASRPRVKPRRRDYPFAVAADCPAVFVYELELPALPALLPEAITVNVWWRPAAGGQLRSLVPTEETTVPSEADQRLMKALMPFQDRSPGCSGNRFRVPRIEQAALAEALAEVSQVRWSCRAAEGAWRLHPLRVPGDAAAGCPWRVSFEPSGSGCRAEMTLVGTSADHPQAEWRMLTAAGLVVAGDELHRIKLGACFPVVAPWLAAPALLSRAQVRQAAAALTATAGAELQHVDVKIVSEIRAVRPTGRLYITTARFKHLGQEQLQADLTFDYEGTLCTTDMAEAPDAPLRFPAADGSGRVIERMPEEEESLRQEMRQCGFRLVTRRNGDEDPGWKLLPSQLDTAVRRLVLAGWQITAEGKSYRRPVEGGFSVAASGIDWLEVRAEVDFGTGAPVPFPELLRVAARGGGTVRLDDGTVGILPQEWLERFTALVEIGQSTNEGVRLRQEQALMLKGLLEEQLRDLDGRYAQVLERLQKLPAAASCTAPSDFRAVLRPSQATAIGWLRAMEAAGLGGILADDMGLGKTIEVLALLAWRHEAHPERPTLVVLPSSLLFNWERELEAFAPQLRWREYYGGARSLEERDLEGVDVLLTTYGTLRRDVISLARKEFDYIILDEAQAIKNAESATEQAARALRAAHRIAMTGTPIENHLAELFSQLACLNPGLFSRTFAERLGRENAIAASPVASRRLRALVAPFVLRRRKEQVATELPPKSEQVLWCELDGRQAELYAELKEYYRQEFSPEAAMRPLAERAGRGGATANMLSALLRLRQVACAAALVNDGCVGVPSAKISLLMEQLAMLAEGGHKALVFSQFTRLLHLVETEVKAAGIQYSYLDGGTADRAEQVRRFQEDDRCKVFLISLKAGGVGLNLTAADYVFVMDPWWNPAAEAQAIDRAYRIGQTRPVFAYRLVARGTIEEKVLQMQAQKRAVAAAALDGRDADPEALPPGLTAAQLQELLEQ